MPYLLLQSLTYFIVLGCVMFIFAKHPLNEKHEQITLLEVLMRKTLILLFKWRGPGDHSGHIMELCDECNNCRDIPLFVILHHFVSIL